MPKFKVSFNLQKTQCKCYICDEPVGITGYMVEGKYEYGDIQPFPVYCFVCSPKCVNMLILQNI